MKNSMKTSDKAIISILYKKSLIFRVETILLA